MKSTATTPTQNPPPRFVKGYQMHYAIGAMTIFRHILDRQGMKVLSCVRASAPGGDEHFFETALLSVRDISGDGKACQPFERFPVLLTGPDCAHRREFPFDPKASGSRSYARQQAADDFNGAD